jgi:hypothetical protein
VVFLKADIHGPFGFTDVVGVTWFIGFACAWGVVHYSRLGGVRKFVLEVNKLVAERILTDGDGADVSLAHGSSDNFCGAAVESEANCGFVFVFGVRGGSWCGGGGRLGGRGVVRGCLWGWAELVTV